MNLAQVSDQEKITLNYTFDHLMDRVRKVAQAENSNFPTISNQANPAELSISPPTSNSYIPAVSSGVDQQLLQAFLAMLTKLEIVSLPPYTTKYFPSFLLSFSSFLSSFFFFSSFFFLRFSYIGLFFRIAQLTKYASMMINLQKLRVEGLPEITSLATEITTLKSLEEFHLVKLGLKTFPAEVLIINTLFYFIIEMITDVSADTFDDKTQRNRYFV